jgi:Lrp/AsnC family leucine-responsive transcriptional regulator
VDSVDRRLLVLLDRNCRASYRELSGDLGLTANAVRNRIRALEESGVLAEYVVILTSAYLEASVVIAFIQTDGSEDPKEFLEAIGEIPATSEVSRIITTSGNMYHASADCVGMRGLADFRSTLERMESVTNVEMHPILYKTGKKREIKDLEFRVLRWLLEDPRMRISEIAGKSGLTSRRVRSAIDSLQEDEVVFFAIRWALNAGGSIEFFLRIKYDMKSKTHEEVSKWLIDTFPSEFWYPFPSASQPILIARFVVTDFRRIEPIERIVAESPFAESVSTLVCHAVKKRPRLGVERLKEMVAQKGLL